jgi:hypothetical protein
MIARPGEIRFTDALPLLSESGCPGFKDLQDVI